ncbi:extracellular solute-binding protein [Vallitalea pronyensis]|uniref:Extracellular solute-binding protein n=1 Tax=Vallitalea pronyensis TaxID=1348613 RepID=A0A8J8SIH6_9FIRM|nr:extracellular solute-binding protein [Vallitalea pronyensis]QUI24464.1 extracellular solute-binding protein [Vallitalea pronyensis]
MKKLVSMILVLMMVSTVILSGCGHDSEKEKKVNKEVTEQNNGDTGAGESEDDGTDESVDGKITFPLKEQITLTAFVHTRPMVDDYDNNAFTRKIEEMTNINLEFIVASANEATERLNLLLSTGDYPDLICVTHLTAEQQGAHGAQGSLIPLNDLIEKYGENTQYIFDNYPEAKEVSVQLDGSIYNLPQVTIIPNVSMIKKLYIYKPWLDNLGLEEPKTTEDFYKVMKAFATEDPNGNGKPDEISLAGAYRGWGTQVQDFFIGSFTELGGGRYIVDHDKVIARYTTDGWKEAMKYLQKLRQEGLLAPESFTQTGDGLKQMGENPDDVILGAFTSGYQGCALNLANERWKDYIALAPLEGPEGIRSAEYNPYAYYIPGLSITDKCKHPEIAMALADLLYSEEMTMDNGFGPKGLGWDYIDDDSKSGFIEGEKAIYEQLMPLADQPPNSYWKLGNQFLTEKVFKGGYTENPWNINKVVYEDTINNYFPYVGGPEVRKPALKYTEEQAAEYATYDLTFRDHIDQMVAEFIVTDVDIDAAWDDYLSTLKSMGLDRFLELQQEAYDAVK